MFMIKRSHETDKYIASRNDKNVLKELSLKNVKDLKSLEKLLNVTFIITVNQMIQRKK